MSRYSIVTVLLFVAPGCQLFHDYRSATVLVRDGDSKKPIPDARVEISYPNLLDPTAPAGWSTKTERNGLAQLWVAPWAGGAARMRVIAGELYDDRVLTKDQIINLNRSPKQGPPDLVVEMYKGDDAAVELIVPTGYRGVIRVDVRPDLEQSTNGNRLFTYPVPPSGEVRVDGPYLLCRYSTRFAARFADGSPLVTNRKVAELGFHELPRTDRGEPTDYSRMFVVGTSMDYEHALDLYFVYEGDNSFILSEHAIERWGGTRKHAVDPPGMVRPLRIGIALQ